MSLSYEQMEQRLRSCEEYIRDQVGYEGEDVPEIARKWFELVRAIHQDLVEERFHDTYPMLNGIFMLHGTRWQVLPGPQPWEDLTMFEFRLISKLIKDRMDAIYTNMNDAVVHGERCTDENEKNHYYEVYCSCVIEATSLTRELEMLNSLVGEINAVDNQELKMN